MTSPKLSDRIATNIDASTAGDARRQFVEQMLEWLNRTLNRGSSPVMEETALFENGLIDSIAILKLIAWTECAIGAQIPDVQIRMNNFHSVGRIADAFLRSERNVDV